MLTSVCNDGNTDSGSVLPHCTRVQAVREQGLTNHKDSFLCAQGVHHNQDHCMSDTTFRLKIYLASIFASSLPDNHGNEVYSSNDVQPGISSCVLQSCLECTHTLVQQHTARAYYTVVLRRMYYTLVPHRSSITVQPYMDSSCVSPVPCFLPANHLLCIIATA